MVLFGDGLGDGHAMNSIGALATYVSGKQVGDTVNLTVLRDGNTLTMPVDIGRPSVANTRLSLAERLVAGV